MTRPTKPERVAWVPRPGPPLDLSHVPTLPLGLLRAGAVGVVLAVVALAIGLGDGWIRGVASLVAVGSLSLTTLGLVVFDRAQERPTGSWLLALGGALFAVVQTVYAYRSLFDDPLGGWMGVTVLAQDRGSSACGLTAALLFANGWLLMRGDAEVLRAWALSSIVCVLAIQLIRREVLPETLFTGPVGAAFLVALSAPLAHALARSLRFADRIALRRWPRPETDAPG